MLDSLKLKLVFTALISAALIPAHGFALDRGQFVPVSSFPSSFQITVMMFDKDTNSWARAECTATKISENLSLTAAHCFHEIQKSTNVDEVAEVNLTAIVGQSDKKTRRADHVTITKVRYNLVHDMAVFQLTGYSPIFSAMPAAAISFEPILANETLFIGGYGDPVNDEFQQKLKMSKAVFTSGTSLLKFYSRNPKSYFRNRPEPLLEAQISEQISELGALKNFSLSTDGNGRLKSGDSGGAVYAERNGHLKIVGMTDTVTRRTFHGLFNLPDEDLFVRFDHPAVNAWIQKVLAADFGN